MPIFLFTDIENSTALWTRYPNQVVRALARQDGVISEVVVQHGGQVYQHLGDELRAVFEEGNPVQCALEIQARMNKQDWGDIGEMRVRVVMHAGEAVSRGSDYSGEVISEILLMANAAWGGQILATPAVLENQMLPTGCQVNDFGEHQTSSMLRPIRILGITHPLLTLRTFPPLRSLPKQAHTLPAFSTPFVGRQAEITAISRLLDSPNCQILTLLGAGGVGKTRLAVEIAQQRAAKYADGIFFIPLASLQLPDLLVPAIAEALHFSFYSREDSKIQLGNYLRDKQMLLILDNFEHIVAAGGLVSSILASALRVKALVTSRERLNLYREYTFPLEGMPYPTPGAEDPEDSPSVQVFLQTARRVCPEYHLAQADHPAIQKICQEVGGMPLALEMAASWVRTLSLGEIADKIQANLDFLVTSSDLPERQQSLRAVFDYSWNLLSEEERRILRKLSVFRGSFSRQAAERVAHAYMLTLNNCIDKSMLRITSNQRYELLETMHQFMGKKLDEYPAEKERIQRVHCEYYTDLLSQELPLLFGGAQRQAIEFIRNDMPNIRLAWEFAITHNCSAGISQAMDGLFHFCDTQSCFKEGQELFFRAANGFKNLWNCADELLLARLSARDGWFSFRLGETARAENLLTSSLATFRRLDMPADIAFNTYYMAQVFHSRGQDDEARRYVLESLEIRQKLGQEAFVGYCLTSLGANLYRRSPYDETRQPLLEALAIFEHIGNRHGISRVFNVLGALATRNNRLLEAQPLYRKSLEMAQELGDQRGEAVSLQNLSGVELDLGNIEEAVNLQARSISLCKHIGNLQLAAVGLLNQASTFHFHLNKPEQGQQCFQESLNIFRQLEDQRGIAFTLHDMAQALQNMGKVEEAQHALGESLNIAIPGADMDLLVNTLLANAHLLDQLGNAAGAYQLCIAMMNQAECSEGNQQQGQEYLAELEKKLSADQVAAALRRAQIQPLQATIKETLGSIFPELF